jgi:hypothetical protein
MPSLMQGWQFLPLLSSGIECFYLIMRLYMRVAFAAYHQDFIVVHHRRIACTKRRQVICRIQCRPFARFEIVNINFLDHGVQYLVNAGRGKSATGDIQFIVEYSHLYVVSRRGASASVFQVPVAGSNSSNHVTCPSQCPSWMPQTR